MTVAPRWIRGPADEQAISEGCHFEEAAGRRICNFLEKFCRQYEGSQWAGKRIELMGWQEDFFLRLYSWKRPNGTRRYRTFYLEVPKKNGKSTMLGGQAIYHQIGDDELGAKVFICAYDRSQASIIYDAAMNMVKQSPALYSRLDIIESKKRIFHPDSKSSLEAASADVPSKDGKNASFAVFDELHRQRTPALWDVFKYAGAARRQPLRGSITTAGIDRQSICYRQREYSQQVNDGVIPDISHLGVIYAADLTDDIEDPATWRKANPSLGITIDEEDFAREIKEAILVPTELNNFLRLRLNIWTQSISRFIAQDKWDACGTIPIHLGDIDGFPCWAGIDLATTTDIAALVMLYRVDGTFKAVCRFWAPQEKAEQRERRDRVPYLTWARQGFLILTPGDVIDYDFIRVELIKLCGLGEVHKVFMDPWNAEYFAHNLKEKDGLPIEFLQQGYRSLSGPTKELERMVLTGALQHGNNPVLNWMCANATTEQDAAGNIKLSKSRSIERIDGMAALVNAIAAAISDSGESVYEDPSHNLLYL